MNDKKVILHKMERFCAYRERCLSEVRQKLYELQCPRDWQEELIVQLLDDDFLNEERYARSFARGKFRLKGWGKAKIRRELWAKEIPVALVEFALQEELDEEEYRDKIVELAEKKRELLEEEDGKELRERVRKFLVSKGFEWEDIDRVLREIFSPKL